MSMWYNRKICVLCLISCAGKSLLVDGRYSNYKIQHPSQPIDHTLFSTSGRLGNGLEVGVEDGLGMRLGDGLELGVEDGLGMRLGDGLGVGVGRPNERTVSSE